MLILNSSLLSVSECTLSQQTKEYDGVQWFLGTLNAHRRVISRFMSYCVEKKLEFYMFKALYVVITNSSCTLISALISTIVKWIIEHHF